MKHLKTFETITLDNLLQWEDDNEESVILDGPYTLNSLQEKEFLKRVNMEPEILKNIGIKKVKSIYDVDFQLEAKLDQEEEIEDEKLRDKLYQIFADCLNM